MWRAKELFLFSGLGADERIFQNINFKNNKATFIKWIDPLNNETIENYALRISKQITAESSILIGVSFGGMMAIEVAKHIKTDKIIIISSVKNKYEIPFYFRWAAAINLHNLLPVNYLKTANIISYWLFGANTQTEKTLLKAILNETNGTFLKWALDKIGKWKNLQTHPNLVHIHGTADKILPIHFTKPEYKIEVGGHFMTLNKHAEIEAIIATEIESF
ncbi:MAG: alpha/beta hydrolase [Bacteroidia bacterium]